MPDTHFTAPPAPGAALRENTFHKTVFMPLRFNKNAAVGSKPHGVITGYASVFNVKDRQGDIVPRGAFTATLAEYKTLRRLPPMLWMHDSKRPCGSWLMMAEDAIGLRVRGQLALGTQLGREALALVKQGAVTGLSIGYRIRYSRFDSAQQARILQSVELDEVSLVTLPANPAALVSDVKYLGTTTYVAKYLEKYNPTQPRVPRGNPTGGQWTDDMAILAAIGAGVFGSLLGGVVAALGTLAPGAAQLALKLGARRLSSGTQNPAIRRAAGAIEEFLGGPAPVRRNKAGDIYIQRGNRKIRFDINNTGKKRDGKTPEYPHFHLEIKDKNGDWQNATPKHRIKFKKKEKE